MNCSGENAGSAAVVTVPEELAGVYQLAQHDLAQVGSVILERLEHSDAAINQVLHYSFRLGGKRLRPLLLILSARACGKVKREHHLAAAALEMIHTGTLIHDDILDGARFRRHLETINLHWDSQFAVLAGDLLLTLAISLITDCSRPEIYPIIAEACRRTCDGELFQVAARGRLDLSLAEYERIIEGKTAALLEASCRLGALLSGPSEENVRVFSQFGRDLGTAFQIYDDVLDLAGSDSETGKTLGTDLLNQKLTLPAIHFLQTAPPAEKNALLALFESRHFGPDEAEKIRLRLLESGAVDFARGEAHKRVRRAVGLLDTLRGKAAPEQAEALDALAAVAEFIANRNK